MRKQLTISLVAVGALASVGAFYAMTPSLHLLKQKTDDAKSGEFYVQASSHDVHQEKGLLGSGAIAGQVLDAEGQPVAGFDVFAANVDLLTGALITATTDKQGKFLIKGLPPGTYEVKGYKADSYPLTVSAFHNDFAIPPRVIVYENQVTQDAEIRLAPKPARLIGLVVDIMTDKPIENALITLRRADNPASALLIGHNSLEEKGKFKILVPPVPFTIEVKAPGYEDWTYSSDGTGKHKDALQLAREETKKLTIALQPAK